MLRRERSTSASSAGEGDAARRFTREISYAAHVTKLRSETRGDVTLIRPSATFSRREKVDERGSRRENARYGNRGWPRLLCNLGVQEAIRRSASATASPRTDATVLRDVR